MIRVVSALLVVAMVVYALIDCSRTPDEEMPARIPKIVWVVLIVVFPGIGALAWIVVSRASRASSASAGRPGLWSGPQRPARPRRRGPVAPDDDPEFLERLERERRRRNAEEREQRRSEEPDDGTNADDSTTGRT
ncbi:PLD nuclease N-terminal domain-containing protein [Georgenia alba]|uniref:PLD nuclease N-terminal domain-containing protein n=1 Tax=Georgenia alba TaxID=2233858 RepID=A0ABW2QCL3_9MICO